MLGRRCRCRSGRRRWRSSGLPTRCRCSRPLFCCYRGVVLVRSLHSATGNDHKHSLALRVVLQCTLGTAGTTGTGLGAVGTFLILLLRSTRSRLPVGALQRRPCAHTAAAFSYLSRFTPTAVAGATRRVGNWTLSGGSALQARFGGFLPSTNTRNKKN